MSADPILSSRALGFPWATVDPFLFCVHHDDAYPAGNAQLGPAASLAGRNIGMDFEGIDGWRMYHGERVPGFPQHPHRGFETVTIVRKGFIDHADSLGATARFGAGDVQWLTAGSGIQHSEMFPLLRQDKDNPLELFQIWLNLPRAGKMVDPYFSMLWREQIPVLEPNAGARVTIIAGSFAGKLPPAPPPNSWASRPEAELALWLVELAPNAKLQLPPASTGVGRTLFYFRGQGARVGTGVRPGREALRLRPELPVELQNGPEASEFLLMQGRPIGEPVAQHGPFVMNSADEIRQAYMDYQRTRFGGWPWPSSGPVHARDAGRFAKHVDGRVEKAG